MQDFAFNLRPGKSLFVPAMPVLSARQVLQRSRTDNQWSLCWSTAQLFYFTRNAIFHAAKTMGLAGKEVLVPAYHHGVEIEALVAAGAIPRFFRVDRRWNIDVEHIESLISENTKVLYLIHYAGFPGPSRELRLLADRFGLLLWEDCALSMLSADGDVPLGSVGDVSFFCLYKTFPVPNGGGLWTNSANVLPDARTKRAPLLSTARHVTHSLLQKAEMNWHQPIQRVRKAGKLIWDTFLPQHIATGTQNFKTSDVEYSASHFSIRLTQSLGWEEIRIKRRRNYYYLLSRLRELDIALFEDLPKGVCPLFFPLVVEDKIGLMNQLAESSVETIDFWRRFHPLCDSEKFGDVAWLRQSILEIPCHQDLELEHLEHVATSVKNAIRSRLKNRSHSLRGIHGRGQAGNRTQVVIRTNSKPEQLSESSQGMGAASSE